jgi:hypothetical protein
MNKTITAIVCAALISLTVAPASAGSLGFTVSPAKGSFAAQSQIVKVKSGKGRGVATGVAIGLGILGIVAAASRASAEADEYARQCRRWRHQCNEGWERACYKYDDRC